MPNNLLLFGLALLLAGAVSASEDDGHAGHDHGGGGAEKHAWEWAGTFDLHGPEEASYVFVASTKAYSAKSAKSASVAADPHAGHDHGRLLSGEKKKTHASWPDETMAVLLLKTDSLTGEGIEHVEAKAEALFNASAAAPYANVIAPGVTTKLAFSDDLPIQMFNFKVEEEGPHVLFAQHFPTEFEGFAGHYLKNQEAKDIEPSAQEPAPKAAAKAAARDPLQYAGQAIGASVVVTLIALVGLALIVPLLYSGRLDVTDQSTFALVSGMFAAGALLATAFMFIFPETLNSLRMAYTGDSDAKQAAGLGGSALAGIGAGALIAMFAQMYGGHAHGQTPQYASKDKRDEGVEMTHANPTKSGDPEAAVSSLELAEVDAFDSTKISFCQCRPKRWTATVYAVLVGDFLHNFADGVAIGVAFKTCDPAFGWVVATGTIAHEISQELADFMVLVTRGRMSIGAALVSNFLSGLSCLIGTLIALYVDMSHESIGINLGFSGGVYCWVAIGECMAYAANHAKSAKEMALGAFFFVFGAVVLGLVLLGHVHCEAPADPTADPHAGHNH
jgi:zinc transporter ZupT